MSSFDEKVAAAREEILAFPSSKVWELWLEYAKNMKANFDRQSIHADTIEKREYARMSYLAFEEFEQIPFVLVRKVEAISQDEAPADLP